MEITSILAVLDGSRNTEAVLAAALAAGRALDATVECLHVESSIAESIPLLGEVDTGDTVHALLAADKNERERRRAHVERAFDTAVAAAGVSTYAPNSHAMPQGFKAGLRAVVGHAGPEIAARGRLFDLIVISPPDETDGGIDAPEFEATLFDTGRPVLIACHTAPALSATKAVVAWDGSREAALALHMAMPLLALAQSVEVVTVASDGAPPDPAEAATFLQRHGIDAEGRQLAPGNRMPADVLIDACREHGAGMLIMGAYGHSPFSEYLFGGVTRRIFEAAPTSILVAH